MQTILVIEDDRATRKALQQIFEIEGYIVQTAASGPEGIELFKNKHPDFVLLDLRMPQMNGQEVCQRLRAESPEVPILILTGSADEIDRVLLLELGADDYVTKPFSPKELMARVRAILRRSRRAPVADKITFGLVSVDFTRMEVVRDGTPVTLAPQEFKMLKYFTQNPECVISRDQMLSEVWGYNSYPSTRTVDSHMLNLRQKLEKDPSSPKHFVTVHNVGYKFIP